MPSGSRRQPEYCQNLREGNYEQAGGERSRAGSGRSGAAGVSGVAPC